MFYENRKSLLLHSHLSIMSLINKVCHVCEASSKLDHHESRDSGQTEADSDDAITPPAFTKTARWEAHGATALSFSVPLSLFEPSY